MIHQFNCYLLLIGLLDSAIKLSNNCFLQIVILAEGPERMVRLATLRVAEWLEALPRVLDGGRAGHLRLRAHRREARAF